MSDQFDLHNRRIARLERENKALQDELSQWQTLRPEVRAFAGLMEARLRENDHKPGRKQDSAKALLYRLREEVEELAFEIDLKVFAVAAEAADVGNFAMMIADVCGWLILESSSC